MAQRTITTAENPIYYALFRNDGLGYSITSALQDQIYDNLVDAQNALSQLLMELPIDLQNKIIIQEVSVPPYNPNTQLRWYITLD